MVDITLFEKALVFAAKAHDGQYRKGTDIPYITHPVALATMLMTMDCPDAVIIAALLHDVIEDTPTTAEEIEAEFGAEIAELVQAVSEPDRDAPWEARKQHTIDKLRHAPLSVKLIACADKTHNLHSMARDYNKLGDDLWKRFNRGKAEQAWYYRSLAKSLAMGIDQPKNYPIFAKFASEVDNLFGDAV